MSAQAVNKEAFKRNNVFRKTGQPCPHCGYPIERMVIAQRSSHYRPVCQPDTR